MLKHRPNELQTPSDLWYTFFYQLMKYQNAIIIPRMNENKTIKSLECLDLGQYSLGYGYTTSDMKYLLAKNLENNDIIYLPYQYIIHMRLHPNQIFANDSIFKSANSIPDVVDTALTTMLDELESCQEIQGVFTMGNNGGYGATLDEEVKKQKINDIRDRIQNNNLLILDSTEKFEKLDKKYSSIKASEIELLEDMFYAKHGLSRKVIDGTANQEDLAVFYNNQLEPLVKNLKEELNYKLLTKTAITQRTEIIVQIDKLSGASLNTMINLFDKGIYSGVFNRNEARSILGMMPYKEGDVYTGNANMRNSDGTTIEGG